MEVHLMKSWTMTSNRGFIKLKYRLKHARLKVMNNDDIHAKLKEINGYYFVTNLCPDPTNNKILYALVNLAGVVNVSRVVEIDLNTGVQTLWPNEYTRSRLTVYNNGLIHGHNNDRTNSPYMHVVYTGNRARYFRFPPRVRHVHRLVDNCIVYELNSKGIHKHVVVQLDKFTQDNVKDMVKLPCTIFDLSAD